MQTKLQTMSKMRTFYLTISTGFAMFSMFFGSGNLVFPLNIGKTAGDLHLFAASGLLITGVLVPFLGLMGILFFHGDYDKFFARIGKMPGLILPFLMLSIMGPFGVIPRCINVAYGSFELLFPGTTLVIFSAVACFIILFMSMDKSKLVSLLGTVLTPVLLIALAIILGKGAFGEASQVDTAHTVSMAFSHGLLEGYQTMDLLAAFFFGAVVVRHLRRILPAAVDEATVLKITFNACVVGATLLAVIYVGFVYLGSHYAGILGGVNVEQYLGTIATHTLGTYAGLVVCVAVILACLTTAVVLVSVFTEFFQEKIVCNKVSYVTSAVLTLVASFCVSTLKFSGIAAFIGPILEATYPGLILLTILNIAHKKYDITVVKLPVYATFVAFAGYMLIR